MALNLEQKKAIVADVAKVAADAQAAVLADYRGLTVSQMTILRSQARERGVYVRVVRNTLAKRAVENTDFACLTEELSGPVLIFFAKEEPGTAARLVRDFAKDHEQLEVTALAMNGNLLPREALAKVANLPTRDEAIAQLMSVMKAPITKFVRTLAEPHGKLVRTLAAVRDQKQAAA